MSRVARIVLTTAGLLVAAVIVLARTDDGLAERGRRRWPHRVLLASVQEARARGVRQVVWFGDSTLVAPHPTFAEVAARDTLAPAGLASTVVAALGLGPEFYYCLLADVLQARPRTVVLLANLRVMPSPPLPYGDVCASLRLETAARNSSTLPWGSLGLSLPRLAVVQALRIPGIEGLLYRLSGLRAAIQEAPLAAWLGPPSPVPAVAPEMLPAAVHRYGEIQRAVLASYDAPIDADTGSVRMLAAAVAAARAAGSEVIVVVSPAPTSLLASEGFYTPERWAPRLATIREAVETAGGTVVDLHDAVPPDGFSDHTGHLALTGASIVAGRLAPFLRGDASSTSSERGGL